MTSAQKAQIVEAVTALQKADLPLELKLDTLNAILKPVLPYDHVLQRLMARINQSQNPQPLLDHIVATALITLPLMEDDASTQQGPKLPDDLGRQIELEVRNSLNEKFVRSPAFMLLLAVVGVGVTVFSFGLFTFSSSARRADAVAADFEKRLTDANKTIVASERDLSKRLGGDIDAAMAKISDMQSNSMKALSSDLAKRIAEVDAEKTSAIQRIRTVSEQFQQDQKDATQSVKDQATKMSPRLEAAMTEAVGKIQDTTRKDLEEFKKQADQTVAELRQPAIKHVLTNSYWLIIAALIMSGLAILFSAFMLVVVRRS